MSEFSRKIDLREIGNAPVVLTATAAECAALAARFDLVAIKRLAAEVSLEPASGVITATGRLRAAIVQSCAVSGEDLPVRIDEAFAVRFIPAGTATVSDAEIELDAAALDELEYTGTSFDLGEAIAQSLVLAIDPYAEGPGAAEARRKGGLTGPDPRNPFAALLKK